MDRKPDADAIAAFLDRLAREPWLEQQQRDWSRYLFHTTDVRNAASILHVGMLYSRREAVRRGLLANDQAADSVMARTRLEDQSYARLYFRPRTPTAWHNEGIRKPRDLAYRSAHCPVPVAFAFDAKDVLTRADVRFSDQSVAHRDARVGQDAAFLELLPWKDVYSLLPANVPAKHAETLVPDRLPLDSTTWVFTRSAAERTTLLTLTGDCGGISPTCTEIRSRIRVNEKSSLFFRRWTYIDVVRVEHECLAVQFNPGTESPGPFEVSLTWTADIGAPPLSESVPGVTARGVWRHVLPADCADRPFRLRIDLDGHLAFLGGLDPLPDVVF